MAARCTGILPPVVDKGYADVASGPCPASSSFMNHFLHQTVMFREQIVATDDVVRAKWASFHAIVVY